MGNTEFYDFEDKNIDFPFYKEGNFQGKKDKIIILFSLLLFVFLILGPIKFFNGQEQLILFLITLISLLMATQCKLSYFFKKISLNDIRLMIVSYIGYEVYYLLIVGFFSIIAYSTTKASSFENMNLLMLLMNILQIISEEIFRILLFLIVLHYSYKHTSNRKKSIIISTIICLMIFGLLHVNTYNYNIIQLLLLQGLGSIFELFGYLKTKNIAIPILIHMLINIGSWIQFLVI